MIRFVMILLLAGSSVAADWPQFLGPTRNSASTEKVTAWTGLPKVLWKQPAGDGHSSPIVVNDVVYLFFQPKGTDSDALAAYDAITGEKKWEQSYKRNHFVPPFGEGPRGTPSFHDGLIYTLGGTGVLAAWDAKTGKIVWNRDTLKEFNAPNLTFGVSASPLVTDTAVYLNIGGKKAGLVAFDRKTGKTLWQATDDGMSYSSPIEATIGKQHQIVFLTKQNLLSVDPTSGEVFWKVPFRDLLSESATAPLQDGNLLIGSSVSLGSIALKLIDKAGEPNVEQVWRKPQLNCYFSTPTAVGDSLYMLNGVLSISPTITLRCVDLKTGEVRWAKEKVGKYHAALIRTANNNLLMLDDDGRLTLFEANPKEYKELARAKICGATWAHPALSNGRVFVRDEKELIGVQLAK